MKAVVIGGCGHIGSWLVPKLVNAGYETVSISRGKSKPYKEDAAWREVEQVMMDRNKETDGEFERKVAAMNADVVIDLINFSLESTEAMVRALERTNLSHYLYCSSIWAHGRATMLPATEDCPKFPLDEYGTEKARSEQYLHECYRRTGFPETVVMPGQISGPGWVIINPAGNTDLNVFRRIQQGEEVVLPNLGMETLHHIHADDVAQAFFNAITHRKEALGESFHAVGAESVTLWGYAQALYRHFGHKDNIRLLPWDAWVEYVGNPALSDHTYYHIARSGQFSIEKGKRLINYQPRHTWLETVTESVDYMVEHSWFGK